ncbi:serine/threonine-protein kinase [Brevibacillus agri]|uniref:serine/threonine protein kinase n=1 Tax=Brevibacillus agri TaxID=51101 RepID=UPI0025B683A0|nr:serine/threonine-protein kinase [Brevibacillus agri]MDN4094572.1 serine/threonine-protein kinase [Brevibacillus agri]
MSKPFVPDITIEELNASSLNSDLLFIQPIGDGGQGTVFKATSVSTGKDVAVKIYSPDQLIKRAELEVKKLEKTNSPFLARLIGYGNFDFRGRDCFYVITEYVKGKDLRITLQERTLTIQEATRLLRQMLQAIDELWKLRIVHCDIKPANIMFSDTGDFQLIDLGLAKHLDTQTITAAGLIMGTFGYMAPEQLRGRKNFTLRVDFFALGIVVYEALTSIHPFQKNQFFVGSFNPLPLSDFIEIDEKLEKAINWMLEPNPIRRPSSIQQILQLIEGVV